MIYIIIYFYKNNLIYINKYYKTITYNKKLKIKFFIFILIIYLLYNKHKNKKIK